MNMDFRIERKFTVGKYNKDFFEKFLRFYSFHKPYADREVSSVYFDTHNYDFLRANIDGIGNRKKIRIRWYDNNFKTFSLEEKIKNNFLVSKKIKKINFLFSEKKFKESLTQYYKSEKDKSFKEMNFQIVLKTHYKRSYWLSSDRKIRATVDTNLVTSPYKYFDRKVDLPETILEFKYLPKYENYFRNFYKNIKSGLRVVKYSKYVKSFFELNNSGLID